MNIELHGFTVDRVVNLRGDLRGVVMRAMDAGNKWSLENLVITDVPSSAVDVAGVKMPFIRVYSDSSRDFARAKVLLNCVTLPVTNVVWVECVLLKKAFKI